MKKPTIIALALLIPLAAVLIFFVTRQKAPVSTPVAEKENAVVLADTQSQENDSVTISYAKLSKPGYVVVTSLNPATKAETIIGTSAWLDAGEYNDFQIPSTWNDSTGPQWETVTVTLVADDGDQVLTDEDTELLDVYDDSTPQFNENVSIEGDTSDIESITGNDVWNPMDEDIFYTESLNNEETIPFEEGDYSFDEPVVSDNDPILTGGDDGFSGTQSGGGSGGGQ
jgi:hypothetical protein